MRRPVSPLDLNTELVEQDTTASTEMQRWMRSVAQNSYSIVTYTVTLNPSSVNANSTEEQTFTIDGLNDMDVVMDVQKPSHTSGLVIGNSRASADDTLAIVFGNTTGSSIDPPSEDYRVTIIRQ